jgi:hypothetical protein
VVLVAISLVAVAAPNTALAQTGPTLVLEPDCYTDPTGEQVYAVQISVTGLAPNSSFIGLLEYESFNPDGSSAGFGRAGPATFTADASGSFGLTFGTVGLPTTYTATVEYNGQTLRETLAVTCPRLPSSKDECKNGGWRSYGVFKNEGDCLSFVATGGKNPPANSP